MSFGLNHVSFSYGSTPVCKELTWHLPETGILCLWGPSGCGKTTLLRLLAGLERPESGEIQLPGQGRVAMVFQEDRLLPWMSALENVMLPGANYLYLARPESAPSVLDILPPNFVLRTAIIVLVITLMFFLAYLPWLLKDKKASAQKGAV